MKKMGSVSCFFRSSVSIAKRGLIFAAVMLMGMSSAAVAVTVTASPTTCASVTGIGTVAWSNATRAVSSNGSYATASVDGSITRFLQCTGYNFAIPAGATINGITVNVTRKSSSTSNGGSADAAMRLVKAGTIGTTDRSTGTTYTTSDVIEAHGSAIDLWGTTWTAADINNVNFGAAFAATKASGSGSAQTVSVDYIQIVVDYTSAPTVTTNAATLVTTTGATLNGTVSSNGASTTVTFDYGLTAGYGSTVTAAQSPLAAGATNSAVSAAVTGLTCGTLYHFRANGVNSSGTTNGGDLTFNTSACPTVISINTASTNPTTTGSAVSWTVTFSDSVTGVAAANFALVQAGGVSGSTITSVTGAGTTWTVNANAGSGTGTLGLNMVNVTGISPAVSTAMPFVGQVYTVQAPLTCLTDTFSSGTLDTSLWNVRTILGPYLPQVVNVGGGDNRLRLTDTNNNEATFAQFKRTFPGAGNKVVLEIDYFAYGGTGADGIAVTFSDATISSTTGGFGGSLGYAQNGTNAGFGGGWLGIGLDEYGNYPNPTESRNGYPAGWTAPFPANWVAGFYKTNVAVRGSGSAQTGYYLLANTGVLATPVAPASGAAGATPYRYRITLDHSDNVHAYVTVERDTTATGASYTTLVPTFDVKGTNSGQAAVPANWLVSFTGSTGGSTNNHEFKQVKICANTIMGGGPDHLEIQHGSGTGVTCTPSTLTIKACADALVPCTPYTAGVSGTLSATGTPTVNWAGGSGSFTIAAGSSTVTKDVQMTTVGSAVFGATSTPAASAATTCNFGTPSCTFTAVDSGFIVTAPNHVAETTSTLTIQAVKSVPGNPLLCAPGMTGTKNVNLKCSYTNPAGGTLPVRVGGVALNAAGNAAAACDAGGKNVSLTFDVTGVATPALQYADVGNMLINASFTGTAGTLDAGLNMVGSGSFITAPALFAFSGITAGLIKAGNPFGATVTAQNALGATTPNFGKESAAEGVTLTSNLVSFVGNNPGVGNNAIPGSEFGAGGMVNDPNGVATVNNLSWGEVGIITLTANLTSGSYLGSGLTATGTSGNVGRFIPHHFDTVVTQPGTTFTYSGQPFTTLVTARNSAGAPTTNYNATAGFSKDVTLSAWDSTGVTQNPGPGALTPTQPPAIVLASAFTSTSTGAATVATPTYTFTSALTAPTTIRIRATDTDSVSSSAGVEGTAVIRSGRLRLSNSFGSEKSSLQIPVQAQYWSGNSWVLNSADNYTSLLANAFFLSGGLAGSTSASAVTITGGVGTLTLAKPSPTATGSVDVAANLGTSGSDQSCLASHGGTAASLPWLRSLNGNCASTYDRDPSARATFGIYAPETKKTVHVRELY